MTEITNAPDLRFPEFNDKWQMMNLSNIVTTIKGNDNQIDLPILTISAKYGWLTQKERFSQVIAGNSLKRYTKVSRGDLSYNKGNSKIAKYGIVYKMNYDEALVPNVYKSFRPHKGINSSFIEKYFHTKKLDRQLRKYISSTARMDGLLNISDNDFYKVNIYIPNSFEQEKIGDFFSKLDRQIELEEKKLELFEQQKRGYMQKIFSQDLRFKDENGNEYPNWKKRKIQDLMEVTSVKRIHQSDWQTNGVPFLRARDIVAYNKGDKIEEPLFISYDKYNAHSKISGKVEKGDLLVTGVGTIGVPFLIKDNKPLYFKDGNIIWLKNQKKLNENFLFYSFLSTSIQNYIKRVAGVGTVGTFTIKNAKKTPIFEPIKEEQEKIGNFFSKLDELINKQNQKIDGLKKRKRGFLQKMFV